MALAQNVQHLLSSLSVARGIRIAMDEVKHDPKNGQFTGNGSSSTKPLKGNAKTPEEHEAHAAYHQTMKSEHLKAGAQEAPGSYHRRAADQHKKAAEEHMTAKRHVESGFVRSNRRPQSANANDATKLANKWSKLAHGDNK